MSELASPDLEKEIIRPTYNRAKHGATMLHQPSLSHKEFLVIAPHFHVRSPRDRARYFVPKFTVDSHMTRSLERGVTLAGELIRYLAGLAKALSEAGLLYRR